MPNALISEPVEIPEKEPDQVFAFITHRAEDRELAENIRDALSYPIQRLKFFLFEDQKAGGDYRHGIWINLKKADWLIFLHTQDSASEWCIYEAGLFSAIINRENEETGGAAGAKSSRRLLCIHCPQGGPPPPLENLTAVPANERAVTQLLESLLGDPPRPDARPLRLDLVQEPRKHPELERLAKDICENFVRFCPLGVSKRYFPSRFQLTLDSAERARLHEERRIPGTAAVTADAECLKLFGLMEIPPSPERRWDEIEHQINELGEANWLGQFANIVCSASQGKRVSPTLPLLVGSPGNLNVDGALYRIDYLPGGSVLLTFVFYNVPPEMDYMPKGDHGLLLKLIRFSWELRWTLVNVFKNRLELLMSLSASEDRRRQVCDELIGVMLRLEQPSKWPVEAVDQAVRLFPDPEDQERIREISAKWSELWPSLKGAAASSAIDEAIDILTKMKEINNVFLEISAKRYCDMVKHFD
jgi:hypothetical protein